MNIYSIIKWYHRIKGPRLKLLGILGLHVLRKRYLYIVLDPSLACNLKCRLCYFSNPDSSKELKGNFSDADIAAISDASFHRGLKLQMGCGAEPTTYKGLAKLVKIGKEKKIPNVSITINGSLLTRKRVEQLVTSGLDELILSTHGLSQRVYEEMMRNADFEHFKQLIEHLSEIKNEHPAFKVRINYTMCADNIDDLKLLPTIFYKLKPDVIQLRPVQDIGSIAYSNYSVGVIADKYEECIIPVVQFCSAHKITCIYPQKENLAWIEQENDKQQHLNSAVDMLPYFHLSPHKTWKEEFNPYEETFEQYAKRTHRIKNILRMLFCMKSSNQEGITKSLNYDIR